MASQLHLPPGYYAWSLKFTGGGVPNDAFITGCGVNSQGYTASAVAALLRSEFVADVLPGLSSAIELADAYVRLGSLNGTGQSFVEQGETQGGTAELGTSPAVAYLAKLSTELGGKRGRGRWFIPGVLEAQIGPDGVLVNAKQVSLTAGLQAWRTSMSVAGVPLAVGHRYEGDPGELFSLLPPSTLTGVVVDTRVATQRGRQRR